MQSYQWTVYLYTNTGIVSRPKLLSSIGMHTRVEWLSILFGNFAIGPIVVDWVYFWSSMPKNRQVLPRGKVFIFKKMTLKKNLTSFVSFFVCSKTGQTGFDLVKDFKNVKKGKYCWLYRLTINICWGLVRPWKKQLKKSEILEWNLF